MCPFIYNLSLADITSFPQVEGEVSSKRIAELEALAVRDKAELDKLVKQMGESMQQNVSLFAQARKNKEEGLVLQREIADLQAKLSASEANLATKGAPFLLQTFPIEDRFAPHKLHCPLLTSLLCLRQGRC